MSGRRERRVVGVGAPGKVTFARGQRQQPTRAEALLWRALRREQLGVKFRRQHAVGEFVLDFYCAERQLAVEIDGLCHAARRGYDCWRDQQLCARGIRVIRLQDELVRCDLEGALQVIREALEY